jgi:hypothetical protein
MSDDHDDQVKRMSTEDKLRAENLQLRLMNIELQEKELMGRLSRLQVEAQRVQKEYLELRQELEKKYDVDLSKSRVRSSDGAILPADSPSPTLVQ